MAPPPRVDADALTRDQALAHASYVNFAAAGMLVAITIIGLTYWPVVPHATLVPWLLALGLPFALRVLLAGAYHRRPDRVTPGQ